MNLKDKSNELASYLAKRSKYVCELNGCTEDEHFCECYAYIRIWSDDTGDHNITDIGLIDICGSDYFQGAGSDTEYVCLCLPFIGNGKDLLDSIEQNRDWDFHVAEID